MAFNVRIFAHEGIEQIKVVLPKQFSADSVFVLRQPYVWSQTLIADVVAVASAPNIERGVTILRIEIPDGQAIRYEINPPNREGGMVIANTNSPILQGKDNFYFAPGWSLSIIDAAALP